MFRFQFSGLPCSFVCEPQAERQGFPEAADCPQALKGLGSGFGNQALRGRNFKEVMKICNIEVWKVSNTITYYNLPQTPLPTLRPQAKALTVSLVVIQEGTSVQTTQAPKAPFQGGCRCRPFRCSPHPGSSGAESLVRVEPRDPNTP